MAFVPQVLPMNVQLQGAENFPTVSQWNDVVHCPANTAESYSISTLLTQSRIKGTKLFVIFSADGPFWANFHGTAAIPSSSTTDGSAPEFSPNQRFIDTNDPLNPITAISFIAAATTNVVLQVYEC